MKLKLVSSTTKVMPSREPESMTQPLCGLRGERVCFQVAVLSDVTEFVKIEVTSDAETRVREVALVPVELPCYAHAEGEYLSREPGLFPDPLMPLGEYTRIPFGQWRAFWIDVQSSTEGSYPVEVAVTLGEEQASVSTTLTVLPHDLPEQKLLVTQWFHYDCIADYYGLEMWSEDYNEVVEKWIRNYVRLGGNMLLTPIFTPALDTQVGGERTRSQLVEISRENGEYRFDFSRFEWFIDLAKRCGVKKFELAHLFSQWGSNTAPNVYVGDEKRFGWHTPAVGGEYEEFLDAFLPELNTDLEKLGIKDDCVLHVYDEPSVAQLPIYAAAREVVRRSIDDIPIFDALSSIEFYKQGCVDIPVVAVDHIEPFIDDGVKPLWGYYCCGQVVNVTNRFIAQSANTERAFAAQAWKHGLQGFLQWGHNFYNTQLSIKRIDPWQTTDAGYAFPSGDAFSVYPGEGGEPVESIRAAVFAQALNDIRAFELCAERFGYEKTLEVIENGNAVRFDDCTFDTEAARARVNELLAR